MSTETKKADKAGVKTYSAGQQWVNPDAPSLFPLLNNGEDITIGQLKTKIWNDKPTVEYEYDIDGETHKFTMFAQDTYSRFKDGHYNSNTYEVGMCENFYNKMPENTWKQMVYLMNCVDHFVERDLPKINPVVEARVPEQSEGELAPGVGYAEEKRKIKPVKKRRKNITKRNLKKQQHAAFIAISKEKRKQRRNQMLKAIEGKAEFPKMGNTVYKEGKIMSPDLDWCPKVPKEHKKREKRVEKGGKNKAQNKRILVTYTVPEEFIKPEDKYKVKVVPSRDIIGKRKRDILKKNGTINPANFGKVLYTIPEHEIRIPIAEPKKSKRLIKHTVLVKAENAMVAAEMVKEQNKGANLLKVVYQRRLDGKATYKKNLDLARKNGTAEAYASHHQRPNVWERKRPLKLMSDAVAKARRLFDIGEGITDNQVALTILSGNYKGSGREHAEWRPQPKPLKRDTKKEKDLDSLVCVSDGETVYRVTNAKAIQMIDMDDKFKYVSKSEWKQARKEGNASYEFDLLTPEQRRLEYISKLKVKEAKPYNKALSELHKQLKKARFYQRKQSKLHIRDMKRQK